MKSPLRAFGLTLALAWVRLDGTEAHARVADPPQRGSLWRHAECAWANPGHQDDDAELFCGGPQVTDPNNGACGLCGDSVLAPRPRNHEIGGAFERGIIVREYNVGQVIRVRIEIVAGHRPGSFNFNLCPYSTFGEESQACFDSNPLLLANGAAEISLEDAFMAGGWVELRLPAGLTCDRCVLQWNWFAQGNRQYYKNCVDIAIQ